MIYNYIATDAPHDEVPLCEGLDSMVQFPQRYVEWMHVAREKVRNSQFQLNNRIDDMSKDRLLELAKVSFDNSFFLFSLTMMEYLLCLPRKLHFSVSFNYSKAGASAV